ncbi:cation:dicarboxylate symporter family transporter, partial [Staphylococcus epidermidis]|uniref:cation:dicarboxylate symporter family transporter n=1 Tax=Staphylococcus epidermidis TaxID=1282 RepID=UPI0037D9DF1A
MLKTQFLLPFSTSTSQPLLPIIINKIQPFPSPKHLTSFLIPIPYSFNLHPSPLYQSIPPLFLPQIYHIHLSLTQQLL